MNKKVKNKSKFSYKSTLKSTMLFFFLPMLIPLAWMLHTIGRYGLSFPYSDAWLIVPTFQHLDQGHFYFYDFWQALGNHRLFFTNILITISAYITNWDTKAEMYMSSIFCIISAFVIYLIIKQTIKNKTIGMLAMLSTAFWLFSPIQSENWLWGWDVAWFMCVAAAIASIYFLTLAIGKRLYIYLGFAIAAGIFTTFTFGWGQAIWPVGILMLLAQRQEKRPIAIWSASALFTYGAYYYHFAHSSPLPFYAFLYEPVNALNYYFIIFGRPFTNSLNTSTLLGSMSLLALVPTLMLVWERRKNLRLYLPWLAIILFALVGAFMILLGRLHIDPNIDTPLTDALQSRYTGMSLLYIVGLSGLIFSLLDGLKPSKSVLKYVVAVVLVIQVPLLYSSYKVGNLTSLERYILMKRLQDCSKEPTDKISNDCVSSNNYLNKNDTAKKQLQYLKDKHWAGY